ncbi:MAG TPA: hypothetical protein PL040_04415 [Bacteroidales bacterium]|nr:hypothetical protein [Bacteroidales bacterium]
MKRFFLLFLLSVQFLNLSAQLKGELKDNFFWGETFILYEEYKDALPMYQILNKVNPTNNNYKYRLGQCLLNIPGRKHEAIPYLEAAVKDINPKYKEGRFRETKAPYDAYYYLANAYRINNQLEKAIATYELFKKNLDPKIYDTSIVNAQIESCRNALELQKLPLYIRKNNQGALVNDQYADINPVVSDDETVMVYNKSEPFQEALYFTKKVNGQWTPPVNMIPYLGLGFEDKNYATSLSSDGRELYIYRAGADYDGNIFITRRNPDDTWTNLIKLNDNINTKYWESHAAISHSGNRLYFTSNRKGSYGGLDIYFSDRETGGDWGVAKNIGPVINTKYNEETPFVGKDDKTLFFSSRGHFNIGGYDIFYSTLLEDGNWSTPLNVGYPLNTTDDDIFFYPVNDGYKAYYSMIDSAGYGLSDIYRIEIFSKDNPRKFFVRGIVKVKDLLALFGDSIRVSAISRENPDSKVVVYSNPQTGEYRFELPQGDYTLSFEAKEGGMISRPLEISLFNPSDTILMQEVTLPKVDLISEMEIKSEKNLIAVKGDTVEIPVKTEPYSVLEIEHWLGDSLLRTEKHIITDSLFLYKAVPETGDNRIIFRLTDKYNNITTSEINITRKKAEEKIVRPEYKYVIAQKQALAFLELLKKRADENLRKALERIDIRKQQFGKTDDLISFIKEETSRQNIPPEEIDRLALKVAVYDNILSQAAVDILARHSEGLLKSILGDLNIYDAKLNSWSDLVKYVSDRTGGEISDSDLRKIAEALIEGIDPVIDIVRKQIQAYGELSGTGDITGRSIKETDAENIRASGEWLKTFYDKALKNNLKEPGLAKMFTSLTALPGTDIKDYIDEFAGYATGTFAGYLKDFNPSANRIKSPAGMIEFLLKNRKMNLFNEDEFFGSLARFIASKKVPADKMLRPEEGKDYLFILWILLGAGVMFFFIILYRRRRKKEEKDES